MESVERVIGEGRGETCPWCDDKAEAERLVNPYATHAWIGEAHHRLARVRDATTEIQMAVTTAHALLLRDRAAAARAAALSERVGALARDLDDLHADVTARFPRPRTPHWIARLIGL